MSMARLEYQYHQDRLRFRLKRTSARGEGKWRRRTDAYDILAERLASPDYSRFEENSRHSVDRGATLEERRQQRESFSF